MEAAPVTSHRAGISGQRSMARTEDSRDSPGGFIFINHNAKRLKTVKDRSLRAAINHHVQKTWQKNNKPKAEKLSQPLHIPHEKSGDWAQESGADPINDTCPTLPSKAALYKTGQLIKFRGTKRSQPRRRKREEVASLPPSGALTHGNSDPFDTLAVPLDATVSHLLQYSKEVMLPSVYSMEVRSTTPSIGITKAWEHVTLAFEDECTISAYLAISATSIMRVAPSSDLDRVALKYNNRSSALLRQKIAERTDSIDPRLFIIVLWLSANALATGDFTAGMIHANTLCFLVKQAGGIAKIEPFQRESIVHFDVQFAMMFLRRPFFDASEYAPGPFNMDWLNDPGAVDKPSLHNSLITYPPLTPSLTSPDLVSAISDLRALNAVYTFTLHNPIPGTSPIFRWLYLQKHCIEAHVLEFCCNLIYSPIQPTTSTFTSTTTTNPSPTLSTSSPDIDAEYASLLAPFSVATLYWTAMAVGYSKQKIHASSMFLTHVRSTLSTASPHLFTASHQTPSNPNAVLRLWILYVGAMAEQALGLSQPATPWRDWCTRRFVLQMRWMGIHRHSHCREALKSILFADRMHREEGIWEGRTVWGPDDVRAERILEGKKEKAGLEREGIESWWGRDGKETGFEKWWRRIDSYFGCVVAEECGY